MGKLFKIALGLFLLGVGVVVIFSVISENNLFAAVNEDDFTYHELVYDADEFSKFDFEFDNRGFIIRESEDDSIKITYYTTEKDNVEVDESGDTLELVNDVEWYNSIFIGWNFFINDEYYDVYVYLPASEVYELGITTSNGAFDVQEVYNLNLVSLITSNGRIDLDGVSATVMNLVSSNGAIDLGNVSISAAMSAVTSNGKVSLDVVSAAVINATSSNGDIIMNEVTAPVVNGSTSNGKILVTDLVSEEVDFDSSNGKIEVSIKGDKDDYEVYMNTTSVNDMIYDGIEVAQNHFNDGAQYEINLRTSNGDIILSFTE